MTQFNGLEKGIEITNAFHKALGVSSRNANKLQLDKGRKFYNRSVKSCLQDNNIKMYSTKDLLEPHKTIFTNL